MGDSCSVRDMTMARGRVPASVGLIAGSMAADSASSSVTSCPSQCLAAMEAPVLTFVCVKAMLLFVRYVYLQSTKSVTPCRCADKSPLPPRPKSRSGSSNGDSSMATAILSEYRKVIQNAAEPLVKSSILTESNHDNVSANNPQLEHFPPDLRQQPRSDHPSLRSP